ncbi:PEP-CTERM sorting domain-containing protein [Massilia sp. CCM 8733]|uniref:PEP-CTERM sorting domain-containing protein n=1 Tax=Massilia mucilaginosa TaxID=2609282 RepID=A0ABX0NZN7_9BURK|nr:EDSAP-1 family PEP-CTERM protein [Massilia mucilaginosa]NHZ92478.1 PEP-CTERM sorting domain-containing protein [Massilia mucilaginosa]
MKLVPTSLMKHAAIAGLCLAAMNGARADAFAQSVLLIDNFRLLHHSGGAFKSTDFTSLNGAVTARATASLNGASVIATTPSSGILSGTMPDVAHQFVGLPTPPRAENDFSYFSILPSLPGTFGYADQNMTGNAMTIGARDAGARVETRADASLRSDGEAGGQSDVGTLTMFRFTLGASETMSVSFDGRPMTQAYASSGSGSGTNAIARLAWSVNIINLDTGELMLDYSPGKLNGESLSSRNGGYAGNSTFDPGWLKFAATSLTLNANQNYQLTINQTTLANAMQKTAVPEPGGLALFGLGLLGMTLMTRRRN